jgi:hypothetical protein
MREKINEEVSVVMYYSSKYKAAQPHLIHWQNKDYSVGEIGYHHSVFEGKTLHHIFELADRESTIWMRLNLDTSNLHWKLEEVADGNAN